VAVKAKVLVRTNDRVGDVSTMVMWHTNSDGTKEQRCPYCFSRKLVILDYDLAEGGESRYGKYKFIKKCNRCGGRFKVLIDIDETGNHMRSKGGASHV
jgi:DNA-directed RNA polymerase subunit RPC12/RpoP